MNSNVCFVFRFDSELQPDWLVLGFDGLLMSGGSSAQITGGQMCVRSPEPHRIKETCSDVSTVTQMFRVTEVSLISEP